MIGHTVHYEHFCLSCWFWSHCTILLMALKLPTIPYISLLLLLVDRMHLSSCSLNRSVVPNEENDLAPLARLPTPVDLAFWSEYQVEYCNQTSMQEPPVQKSWSVCYRGETHKGLTAYHPLHSPKIPTWDFILVIKTLCVTGLFPVLW